MGVKQGFPPSFSLFGVCIHQLNEFTQESLVEHEEKRAIGHNIDSDLSA